MNDRREYFQCLPSHLLEGRAVRARPWCPASHSSALQRLPSHLLEGRATRARLRVHLCIAILFLAACAAPWAQAGEADIGLRLALRLSDEGDQRASAIEFRRLGMSVEEAPARAGYYWAAAHQYYRAEEYSVAETMLDWSEDAWPAIERKALLLRAETAGARQSRQEASFYWETLLRGVDDAGQERLARRRLAALRLEDGRADEARVLLAAGPGDEAAAMAAIERYEAGRDKRPAVGGALGMIPGMGYAYAGEYANAFRSLILNALFIYGMVDTAQNNHWGGFAVITFFEITWYTGSIYGGIDASHRYNQRRLEEALDGIQGGAAFHPEWEQLPAISLRYVF